ncbi:hypothetical protein GGI12_000528 [Dipsacomyces acuminosporus]|nr:hypothetical protein GGI12_000528 [Dipsacomyces acuminosporus]
MASLANTNIAELETLRGQLQQLQESFGTIIEETRPTPDNPNIAPWPVLLSKFNILAARYATLSQAVNRAHASLLRQTVVAPQRQLQSDHEQQILSVLLRTKLAPEIEREEEAIRTQVDAEARHDRQQYQPNSFSSGTAATNDSKYWQSKTEVHDSLALTAQLAFQELRKKHASTVEEMLAERLGLSGAPGTQSAPLPELQAQNAESPAATASTQKQDAVALEDVLAFVSSGTRIQR